MINTFVALLVVQGVVEERDGEALAEKLRNATLPGDYGSALRQVKQFLEEIKQGR